MLPLSMMAFIRDGELHVNALKLKTHQMGWQPCEIEALAITAGVKHFETYIRKSTLPLQISTDNKPCIQAFKKLCTGKFSASSRVSTFLSCLSEHNVSIQHLKGEGNRSNTFHPGIQIYAVTPHVKSVNLLMK